MSQILGLGSRCIHSFNIIGDQWPLLLGGGRLVRP